MPSTVASTRPILSVTFARASTRLSSGDGPGPTAAVSPFISSDACGADVGALPGVAWSTAGQYGIAVPGVLPPPRGYREQGRPGGTRRRARACVMGWQPGSGHAKTAPGGGPRAPMLSG